MIKPEKLEKGSKITILSPAGFVDKKFVESTKIFLESKGFKVEVAQSCNNQHNRFAGTDEERIYDLQKAIDDNSTKAILCARGGYGTIRIIDKIDFSNMLKNPKWIIGFSDITVLHSHLNNLGIMSIHGPMAKAFHEESNSDSIKYLINILLGKNNSYTVKSNLNNNIGICEGELVGGNLSTLYSLQGTSYEINTENKILFIEDLCEHHYHIDRILTNFKLSNKFKKVSGLICGSFTELKDSKPGFGKNHIEIINEKTELINFPKCYDFPSGHILNNYPLVLGAKYHLSIDSAKVVLESQI
jgi:muramoyltetrapeptide carboxypeptidase